MTCLKVTLHIFNVLYLIIGIAVLTIGVWTQVDLQNYFTLSGISFANAGWVMIGAGLLVMLIASLGFYCTQKGNVALLNVYGVVILLIFLLQVAAGIAGAVFKDQISTQFQSGLTTSIADEKSRQQWEKIQQTLSCCGVQNYTDWGASIPESCCQNPPCKAGDEGMYPGCGPKVLQVIMRDLGYVIGVAFGLVVLQLLGSIVAFCLARGLRKHNYEEIY